MQMFMTKYVFNSKFIPYEGESNGAQLNSLLSMVIQSNITYPERKITINDMKNVNEIQNYQKRIESSSTYSVKLNYDTSGFVNSITITPK